MNATSIVALGVLVLDSVSGCSPKIFGEGDEGIRQLRARAAFDLTCPERQLKTVTIDDRTRGVSGCGEHATYVSSCDTVGPYGLQAGCTWILNADSMRNERKSSSGPTDDNGTSNGP
jgi:hypothetical protein